jgi:hypothetical protein
MCTCQRRARGGQCCRQRGAEHGRGHIYFPSAAGTCRRRSRHGRRSVWRTMWTIVGPPWFTRCCCAGWTRASCCRGRTLWVSADGGKTDCTCALARSSQSWGPPAATSSGQRRARRCRALGRFHTSPLLARSCLSHHHREVVDFTLFFFMQWQKVTEMMINRSPMCSDDDFSARRSNSSQGLRRREPLHAWTTIEKSRRAHWLLVLGVHGMDRDWT